MMEKLLKAPNGAAIDCITVDTPGRCGVFPPTPAAVEKDDPEYNGGGTDHDYNGQRVFKAGGQTVWRDDCGDGWLGWMLIPENAEPVNQELQDELVVVYELTHAFDSAKSLRDQLGRLTRDDQIDAVFSGSINTPIVMLEHEVRTRTEKAKEALREHLK
jgi:hypothetical protein